MSVQKLGDICELKYGSSLPASTRTGETFPVFGSNGRVGSHEQSVTKSATIIVGRKGSIGEINFSDGPCWPIDTTYYVDETCTQADLRWLHYAMGGLRLGSLNKATGVPGLNRNDAYERELFVPPLDEQKRIAAILDQADDLRRKRQHTLDRLNQLGQSIFHEMFGDLTINERAWPQAGMLSDYAEIASGITKGRKVKGGATRSIPYLAVVNVQDKRLQLEPLKEIEATEAEIERYRIRRNDLLLTEGGDPDKLGRGTLWNDELPECIHQNHVFRVRIHSEKINAVFLNWLVGSLYGKSYFLKSAKQTTGIASINSTQLKAFPMLVPPLEIQEAFSARINRLRKKAPQWSPPPDFQRAGRGPGPFRGEIQRCEPCWRGLGDVNGTARPLPVVSAV